ncbi:MAG: MFS transporter [Actinomycetota bacterium]|nr:MFS transporter [Actinomycetota bacterium]
MAVRTEPALSGQPAVLAVLLSGWFLTQFDFFVVNIAAPSFERQLGAGPLALELIVGGYAFAYATGMITGGRLGDRYGHRRIFVIGMLSFTAASLLCGLAPNAAFLVATRLLQGLACAVMAPQILATITATFPKRDKARALAWYGVTGGVGAVAGQVLGGVLLNLDLFGLGWRVIFLINVPIGLVAAVLAGRLRLPTEPRRPTGQDPLGTIGIALAVGLILAPLALGRTEGWPAWTWICIAAGLIVACAVAWWQRFLSARGGDPVLDLTLLRQRSYLAGLAATAAFLAYFTSFMFTLTLLLQGGLGRTPLEAGLTFAPMGIMFSATALLGARLFTRYALMVVIGGGVMVIAGLGLTLATPASMIGLILVGAGNGLVFPHLIGAALAEVAPHKAGVGAAVLTTTQQFAGSAGVTLIGTIFFAVLGSGGDHVSAMRQSTLIDIALMLVMIALVTYIHLRVRRDSLART